MRLIGIAGTSRSGKSSTGSFIFANELKKLQIIEKFEMDENGDLYVNHGAHEESGLEPGMAKVNLESKDPIFVNFLQEAIWPHVKLYSFADILKFIAIHMYGLTVEQVYGGTRDKNSDTNYSYAMIKKVVPGKYFPKKLSNLNDAVTARKFLQYLADTLRTLNDDCFLNPVMNQILNEQVPLSIITDVRRIVEADKIKEMGGKVIFLTRKIENDTHRVENEFDEVNNKSEYFDIVIDNQDMTMAQKNVEVFTELRSRGWL